MSQNTPAGSGDLRLTGLVKRFGTFAAVDGVDLTIPQGSFFALLGPSGCGKTTTLRMIAGLETPTEGAILLGDTDISHTKPYKRPVNTVFQNYALFPHLDIFENVAFGLRRRGIKSVKAEVMAALDLVELAHVAKRKPPQLSGGQQQRIALARAVVNRPQVLLLDEPLGALDLKLRRQMQLELKRIQTEVGITFVHVTHDQEEAMTMADTVAVMNHGKVEQLGDPVALYESPRTSFVANFLGQSNLIQGRRKPLDDQGVPVICHEQALRVPLGRVSCEDDDVLVGVRPEKLHLVDEGREVAGSMNALHGGVIVDASFTGMSTQYQVRMPWGQDLTVFAQNMGANVRWRPGRRATLAWEPSHTFVLPAAGAPVASVPAPAPSRDGEPDVATTRRSRRQG
ncbi:MAG: ABC transporter ATP-binding protein [Kineosporiaceae bacterium]